MDSESLQTELSALRKLYGLLQINESSEQSSISEILDEESRVLLRKLLDDASEKVFEAHMKIMADKWRSLLGTQCLDQLEEAKRIEISRPSTPSFAVKSPSFDQNIKENVECHSVLPQDEQPFEIKMPNKAPVVTSRLRRSATELQSRKKRCLSCEQGSKLEAKQSSESVVYSGVLGNKRTSVIDCKSSEKESVAGSFNSMAPRKEVEDKASNVEDFSKEVDDAIRRIESLIPSLHHLAKPVQAPAGKKMGNLNSFRKTNSVLDLDATGSSLGGSNGISARTEQRQARQSKQADQGIGECHESAPRLLHPPQRSDYESLKEDEFEGEVKLLKNTASQFQLIPKTHHLMSDTPSDQDPRIKGYRFLEESTGRIQGEFGLGDGKPIQRTNVSSHLHGNVSQNDNVAGQIPHHIQDMRILPSQFNEDNVNQYRIPQREARRKTPTSRSSLLPPSTSSTSFGKARERVDTRNAVRRANQVKSREKNPSSRRKTGFEESSYLSPQPFDESDETHSGSPGSSSWVTGEASSSFSPSDTIQTTSSCTGENEDSGFTGSSLNYQDVGSELSGTRYETSQTSSRYDASSNSSPGYGDSNPSEYYKTSHHSVRNRQAGKFKRLKNKLGLIFHHHHHHHHHHHDKGGQAHGSVWKHLGNMFSHTEKEEAKKPKAGTRNKDKHLAKSGSRKQQTENLHTLVEGLMKQAKKKPKQGKGGVGKPGGRNLVGKKARKKPSCWQNKARVKLPGRDKKPQLTAPKSHLRHS